MESNNVTVESIQLLILQKDEIEAELLATRSWLLAPGNLGLSGGLLDEEGFPINDVDKIIATREARGKLARLQNDHLDIMNKIEAGINELHLKARNEGTPQHQFTRPPAPQSDSNSSKDTPADKYSKLKPFAKVNSVAQLSPSFKAGLNAADEILLVGDVCQSNGGFEKLKDLISKSEDKEILVVVRRNVEASVDENNETLKILELTLKPCKWAGPGLLGCHLLPLSTSP